MCDCVEPMGNQILTEVEDEAFRMLSINADKPLAIVQNRRAIFLNDKLIALAGYLPDDAGPDNFLEKIMPDTDPEGMFSLDDPIGTHDVFCKLVAFPILKKDGDPLWCEICLSPIAWYGKRAALLFFTPFPGIDHSDPEIGRAHNLKAIGLLSAGIVHDLNNLLAVIIGFIQLAQDGHFVDTNHREYLAQALNASFRAQDLTQKILSLGQAHPKKKILTDMARVVEMLLGMVSVSFPKNITIRFVCKNVRPILADPNDMFQLLLNLCINARHAVSGKTGTIDIHIEETTAVPMIHIKEPPGRRYLSIRVADNGHGIEKKLMDHIFDPYFTTKEKGQGTGIGLALVKHIVHEYGGVIALKSTPGEGTRFTLFIPYTDGPHESP